MNNSQSRQNEDLLTAWVRIGLILMLSITIVIMLIAVFDRNTKGEASVGSFGAKDYNEGWVATYNDTSATVSLPAFIECEPGDEIIITNTLPANLTNDMSLMIRSTMEDVAVYIDGRLREEYSTNSTFDMSYYLPSAYVVANINAADAGKSITVHFTVKNRGTLNAIRLGHGNNVWFEVIKEGMVINVLALLEFAAGIIASGAAYILGKKYKTEAVWYLGILMMDVAMWMIAESVLRQIIFNRPSMSQYFSYLTLELIGPLACMYFDAVQHRVYHRRYIIVESIVLLQVLINTLLHMTGKFEFYETLAFTHALEVACAVVIIVNIITDIKEHRIRSYRISAIGAVFFVAAALGELTAFYVSRFRDHFGIWLCLGLLCLLIFTIVQMVTDVLAMFHEKEKIRTDMTVKTIETIAGAIDARDEYTGGHSERVGMYAQSLARQMAGRYGFTEDDILRIHYIGLIHDIGKIGVADSVLNKAGKLTDEEFSLMKKHPEIGYEIMSSIGDEIEGVLDGIRYHHERYDGRGYPDGLAGEAIPLVARILCIADSYDAMTSNRVYRKRLTNEEVINEFKRCAGTQFDPDITDIFIKLLEAGELCEMTVDGMATDTDGKALVSASLESRLQGDLLAQEKIIHPSHVRMLCYMIKLMEKKGKYYRILFVGPKSNTENITEGTDSAREELTAFISANITAHDTNIRYNETLNVVALFDRNDEETEAFVRLIKDKFPDADIS